MTKTDLVVIQERQAAIQIVAKMGAKAVGNLLKRIDIKSFRDASYVAQMRMATKQLYRDLGDKGLEKHFNKEQINAIRSGKSKIPGFTWHHQDTGRMQLVNEDVHNETGHIGGTGIGRGK